MKRLVVSILILHTTLLSASVLAQTDPNYAWCAGKNNEIPDLIIGGCTSIIQSGKLDRENLAFAFFNRGLAFGDKQELDAGIRDLNQAVQLKPNYARALAQRARFFKAKSDLSRALSDITEAIRIEQTADRYYERALIYRLQRNNSSALEDIESAIRLEPNHKYALYQRASLLRLKNIYEEGVDELTKAIKVDQDFATAYALRCLNLVDMGRYSDAVLDCSKAISLDPKEANTYNTRGVAYQKSRQNDLARNDFTTSIQLNPRDSLPLANRCIVLRAMRQIDEAAADCEKALSINPGNAAALYHLGIIKTDKGKAADGAKDIARARQLDPTLPEIRATPSVVTSRNSTQPTSGTTKSGSSIISIVESIPWYAVPVAMIAVIVLVMAWLAWGPRRSAPAAKTDEQTQNIGDAAHQAEHHLEACQLCRRPSQTAYASFHRNVGLLFARVTYSVKGRMCRSCLHKQFWSFTGLNLLLGWWGVISFFLTPIFSAMNIASYLTALLSRDKQLTTKAT